MAGNRRMKNCSWLRNKLWLQGVSHGISRHPSPGRFCSGVRRRPHRRRRSCAAASGVGLSTVHNRARRSRQQVAFQLWPDSSEEQARNNLRKVLHQLRHALPDYDRFLYIDSRTVQWRADAPYTLDVDEFASGLQRAAARPDDPAAQQTLLTEAIAHYQGDLLPSCYEEWIIPSGTAAPGVVGRWKN